MHPLPPNNEMHQTKGAKVRAPRHSASRSAASVPRRTIFINAPSQVISVLDGLRSDEI